MADYVAMVDGKYLGYDAPSGGYPYKTNSIHTAYVLNDPVKLIDWVGSAEPNAKIFKVEYLLSEVAKPDIEEKRRQSILQRLSPEERRILGV